ncbi:MAG: uroporphyrinogen-III C-methyltransferase [Myxococcales bacterium]|nr:uroporphyrinogen-III C-methyltransferase [Myxococcales bacterium]
MAGFVSIVGAGPWDPELLTLAGRDRLARADVVVADYLVNPALLMHCRPDVHVYQRSQSPHAETHGDAVASQDEIHAVIVDKARAGLRVVRLKGGDPMVFGRGGEEAQVLRDAGIDYEFVPGVSAAIAAPEAAGIPVTHRDHTPSVTLVSGYEAYEKGGRGVDWQHLARGTGTLVLMMSVRNCRDNAERLIAAGRDPATPAALVRWGTRGIMRTIVAPLAQLADRADAEGLRPPAVMIVGSVVDLRGAIQWYERRPLFGRRVVVTRAADHAGELLNLLAAQGADAVHFPCLAIAPPHDLDALTRAARSPEDYDGVILSSPNGVRAWFDALAGVGVDVRILHGKCVAAIGTGTANACWERGIRADIVPTAARSEGLVHELRARNILNRRWLHVRADEGRDLVGEAIHAAGGTYALVVGYRVVRPRVPALLVRSLLPPEQGGEGCDAVCLASGKTARHFVETLGEAHGEAAARELLARAKVLALGPVTAAAVRALDIRVDAVADDLTDQAMLAAVLTTLGRP